MVVMVDKRYFICVLALDDAKILIDYLYQQIRKSLTISGNTSGSRKDLHIKYYIP